MYVQNSVAHGENIPKIKVLAYRLSVLFSQEHIFRTEHLKPHNEYKHTLQIHEYLIIIAYNGSMTHLITELIMMLHFSYKCAVGRHCLEYRVLEIVPQFPESRKKSSSKAQGRESF